MLMRELAQLLTSDETRSEKLSDTKMLHRTVSLRLKFAFVKDLSTQSLLTIENFLDRVYANPDQRFSIDGLDLSGDTMDTTQLGILTRILSKSNRIKSLGLGKLLIDDATEKSILNPDQAGQY